MILQGEDGEVRWVMYQIGFILIGLMGLLGICLSGAWIAHIIVYMLPYQPINPMLNTVFIQLDQVWSLLGVTAFALFCLYLMGEWLCPTCMVSEIADCYCQVIEPVIGLRRLHRRCTD